METCQLLPTICGAGEATSTQFPNTRLVRVCNVYPADASGHDRIRFDDVATGLIAGLLVLNC